MQIPYATALHPLFKQFAERFILNGNSLLTNDTDILTGQTLGNCFNNYIENYQTGKSKFFDKVADQFALADLPTKLAFAHAEWLWSFAVNDITVWRKRTSTCQIVGIPDNTLNSSAYIEGFGSAGTYHKNHKYEEIRFNLYLIRFLREKCEAKEITTVDEICDWTEKVCLYQKYDQEFTEFPLPESLKSGLNDSAVAMCNILCYVAKPEDYERIASDNHKRLIYNAFSGLLTESQRKDETLNTDARILLIRQRIAALIGNATFDFYDEDDVVIVWNYNMTEEGFTVIQGLQYKKAIILYGPPGTSKTYTATRLAQVLIRSAYLRKPENVESYFKEDVDYTEGKTHHLQLHSNYNYEDFVAGMQLQNHHIEAVKGNLFDICEAAEKDKSEGTPHVLILDEINRVDLSRLFGEVFSALENRDKPIAVSVGKLALSIPSNLYVIGTMNEIDFSLERMDFALRRRFLWFPYGFDAGILRDIIRYQNGQLSTGLNDQEIERFINNTVELNKAIQNLPELGEQYQIGHTFFAEIVPIYQKYKEVKGYVNKMKNQIYRGGDGPSCILWDISIKPMINAFLGNMDQETKNDTIDKLFELYDHG
jgi:5-methylcytosine-specific restriction protein B